MGNVHLFLVDRGGRALRPELREAVESAYRRVTHDYPGVDSSLVSTWAEEVGASMAEKQVADRSLYRYASMALQAKVREEFRRSGSREVLTGSDRELDDQAGGELQTARRMDRQILFRELRSHLSERDRRIFILLLQDITSPESIGSALGISYGAAGKAVQRLRERLRAVLADRAIPSSKEDHDEQA